MPLHSILTGADLHEPKGADSASQNTVYIADGNGSGTWSLFSTASLGSSFKNVNTIFLSGQVPDLSTNGSEYLVPVPVNMVINSITYTLTNAISVAAGALIVTNPGVGNAATIIIPFAGTTEGTTGQVTISTNNVVAAGSYIKVVAATGSTTACKVSFVIAATIT